MVIDSQRGQDQPSVDYNRHVLLNSIILNASNWVSCIMPYGGLLYQIKMMCRILAPVIIARCFYTSCQVFGAKVNAVEVWKFSSGGRFVKFLGGIGRKCGESIKGKGFPVIRSVGVLSQRAHYG